MNGELERTILAALREYRRIYKSSDRVEQRWPGLTEWIARNKDQYGVGRSIDDAEYRLGQWCITFRLLFPGAPIPVHPCEQLHTAFTATVLTILVYDLSVSGGTLASETFTQILEAVARSTMEQHGLPASNDVDSLTRYFVSLGEASAGIASRTTLRDFNNSRPVPSVAPRPSEVSIDIHTHQQQRLEGDSHESLDSDSPFSFFHFSNVFPEDTLYEGFANMGDQPTDELDPESRR